MFWWKANNQFRVINLSRKHNMYHHTHTGTRFKHFPLCFAFVWKTAFPSRCKELFTRIMSGFPCPGRGSPGNISGDTDNLSDVLPTLILMALGCWLYMSSDEYDYRLTSYRSFGYWTGRIIDHNSPYGWHDTGDINMHKKNILLMAVTPVNKSHSYTFIHWL